MSEQIEQEPAATHLHAHAGAPVELGDLSGAEADHLTGTLEGALESVSAPTTRRDLEAAGV
ncbi:hypothetical protein ABH920_002094 [Catenulispora sp. EB89]|uniref:hypothetical protein n=1 Tax=Catenulispora sp. EB89 TaxID=3156257 RepID=UPI003513948C